MKIIKELILEKLKCENILLKHQERENAFGEHICAYMMSLAYLNKTDPDLMNKIRLWKKFVQAKSKAKYYDKLLRYKQKEDEIIVLALTEMEKTAEAGESDFGTLWKPFTVAILSYEANELM